MRKVDKGQEGTMVEGQSRKAVKDPFSTQGICIAEGQQERRTWM